MNEKAGNNMKVVPAHLDLIGPFYLTIFFLKQNRE